MTSPETRLREALHDAGSVPVGSIDFDQLAQNHQRRARRCWAAGGSAAVAVVALAIWAGTGGNTSAGRATLVPATPPSASPDSPRVVGITKPIVLAGGPLRLDPAGAPPASTASIQRLLAADTPTPYGGRDAHTQLLYGAFTHDTADLAGTVCCGGHVPTAYNHRLAVWIVDHGFVPDSPKPVPVAVYTAVDPLTAQLLFRWTIDGPPPPSPPPVPFPDLSPGPSVIPPQTGIIDNGGQFHATYWQGINAWQSEVAPNRYLDVYAGGQPVDPSLERTDATLAGVLVLTPADQLTGPAMSNGTRYLPSPAPAGKFQIVGVNGAVLTLQLVGTSQTYTFNTNTDTYG
jgi:hypothetical protein